MTFDPNDWTIIDCIQNLFFIDCTILSFDPHENQEWSCKNEKEDHSSIGTIRQIDLEIGFPESKLCHLIIAQQQFNR